MRFTAYAGASTLLALGVVLRAFNERPNFYSATVYLAQSNACRMILLNLVLLCAGGFMFGLQRLLYGPLRPIEIEQLWDKSWYAITETALAMTTFRDEVGGWFFLMFISLLAGKVWQWISEGRLEILEQQPPSNPRLFHIRLISSLLLSEFFDVLMLRYCVQTLLEQPKPGMMVMFAFEFAVLTISSSSIAARYFLSLHEAFIIKRQITFKLEERRDELRVEREEVLRQSSIDDTEDAETNALESMVDINIDEDDIDVPGWQEKGRWILFLDLTTDFLKLLVYIGFFTILLVFHGIPIHILRDVFVTARSFLKRISDFIKYRNATRDMNTRYADATSAELEDNGTCIICREEMRPWQQPELQPRPGARAQQDRRRRIVDERQRPKKLPCGHILHFGCLRSWLERQQVCPTCRSSVLSSSPATQREPRGPDQNLENPENLRHEVHPDETNQALQGRPARQLQVPPRTNVLRGQAPRQNEARARTFTLGPWRVTLATGNEQQVNNTLQRLREQNAANVHNFEPGTVSTNALNSSSDQQSQEQRTSSLRDHIDAVEQQLLREIQSLNIAQEQLAVASTLHSELARLRMLQSSLTQYPNSQQLNQQQQQQQQQQPPTSLRPENNLSRPYPNLSESRNAPVVQPWPQNQPNLTTLRPFFPAHHYNFASVNHQTALGPNHPELPAGMSLPEGWTVLPLQSVGPERESGSTSRLNHTVVPTSASGPESEGLSSRIATAAQTRPTEVESEPPLDASTHQGQGINEEQRGSHGKGKVRAQHPSLPADSITKTYTSSSDSTAEGFTENTSSIPQWSFDSDQITNSGSRSRTEIPSGNSTAADSGGIGECSSEEAIMPMREDKGKGKIVSPTIEDASEEDES